MKNLTEMAREKNKCKDGKLPQPIAFKTLQRRRENYKENTETNLQSTGEMFGLTHSFSIDPFAVHDFQKKKIDTWKSEKKKIL
jgi:hypothetical protein